MSVIYGIIVAIIPASDRFQWIILLLRSGNRSIKMSCPIEQQRTKKKNNCHPNNWQNSIKCWWNIFGLFVITFISIVCYCLEALIYFLHHLIIKLFIQCHLRASLGRLCDTNPFIEQFVQFYWKFYCWPSLNP